MSNADVVLYEKQDAIAFLTINRPEAMNALNTEVNLKLIECLDRAEKEQDVRVVIMKGAGDKAFIAGGDIKEMITKDAMGARDYALAAKKVIDKIWNHKKPVIAAINGFCLGGGMEYAMSCDLRIASEKSRFGQPEINIGIMPGSAGTQRLSRLIGVTKAKQLCFTGDMINAAEALSLGLINEVYPAAVLMEKTVELAKKIASKSAPALTLMKAAINRGTEMDLESAALFEIDCFGLCFATEEQKQAMNRFVNKGK